jgi:hypothetical protein
VAGYGRYNLRVWPDQRDTLRWINSSVPFSEPFSIRQELRLPWETSGKFREIEQGQGVQVLTNNDVVYTFTGIQSPDRAWAVLVRLHNDALLDRHQRDNVRHRTLYAARIQAKKFSALVGD